MVVMPADHNGLPKYVVEDLEVQSEPPMDIWADYLRMRYANRHVFYKTLKPAEQELIRKELRRIRYFRRHFKDYRISATDDQPLVARLEASRTYWREMASSRAPDELAKLKKDDKQKDASHRERNRRILEYVRRWHDKDYLEWHSTTLPDAYMPDLEAHSTHAEDEDPRQSNYGYNGWLIAWEEGRGGVTVNQPHVTGSFPHQKISIQQLLYNTKETPLKRDPHSKTLRYFHLPANSMQWVEDAISRYYGEENVEFDGRSVLNKRSYAQRLLRNDLWRGQERGGAHLPSHSRQMAARCAVVPTPPVPGPKTSEGRQSESRRDIALFMPFLHWEIEKRLHRMSQFVQVAKSQNDHAERLRRASTSRWKGRMADIAQLQQMKPARPVSSFDTKHKGHSWWRPQTALAKYIWHAAKLFQIIDEAADGRLIEHHLFASAPLHMRRTLEQYYYWTASDTSRRDSDQVVCRATRSLQEDGEAIARIVMVDQLWLWILDENTVITAFPRRWGRNKPDPSAVHRGIRDRMGSMGKDQIRSVYDLSFIIIDECSKVFFDRTKPLDQRPEVVDLFSSAISKIAENKTVAYEEFGNAVSKISIDRLGGAEKMIRRSLNIGFEWSILADAQQVIEELEIMQGIFTQQLTVMNDLQKILVNMKWATKASDAEDSDDSDDMDNTNQRRVVSRVGNLISDMEVRRAELQSMELLQTKTRTQLRELLDMKQQQANIIEAKAAIKRADETVMQGRSIVVFTVITIIFLPLSFMTSVFGMNARELSEDGAVNLDTVLIWMFSASAIIVVISLALAFSTYVRTLLTVGSSLIFAYVHDKLGLRDRKSVYNLASLKNKQRAMHTQREKAATMRRLTEISSRQRELSTNVIRALSPGPSRPLDSTLSRPPPPPMRRNSSWGLGTLAAIARFRGTKSVEENGNGV